MFAFERKPKEEGDDRIAVHVLFSLNLFPVAEFIFTPEDTCPKRNFLRAGLDLFVSLILELLCLSLP